MEEAPRVIASRGVFEGRVFRVRVDDVRYEDGSEHRIDVVEHGASVAIVATPTAGSIVLVRQYRLPTGRSLWEIPAGMSDPDENPADGARRELREETGYLAGRLRPLGSTWTTPGFCSEIMHFFHADQLTAGAPDMEEDERIEVRTCSHEAAWRLVAEGTADAKTLLALFWLQGGEGEFGSHFGR
jgi:ADP-ribose pyrophosphatase